MTNSAEVLDLMNSYHGSHDTMDMIHDIFTQGNPRYLDPRNEAILAGFIDNDAISIRRMSVLPKKQMQTSGIPGPQKELKSVAIELLEENGYEIVSIERSFPGGIPDILARKGNDIITIECGPCRISKPIDYLENSNTTLWIIRPLKDKFELITVKRSRSWNRYIKLHRKNEIDQAKKHIDDAFEDFE